VYGLHLRHVCMPSTIVWSSFRKHGVKSLIPTDAVRYQSLLASIPSFQKVGRTASDRRKRNRKSPRCTTLLHSDNDRQRFLRPRTFQLDCRFRLGRVKAADLMLPFSSIHSWSYFFTIVNNLLLPLPHVYFILLIFRFLSRTTE